MPDLATIVWKELVQVAHRRRFHLEKAFFAMGAAAAFAWLASRETSLTAAGAAQAEAVGRRIFFPVVIGACAALSLISLGAASGIIMSERTGKRLDLLRITPIPLSTIVVGKGLALMGRALLIALLLLPFVAAMQFFRGVAPGDIAKAFLLISTYVFFCVTLGLIVSAGSTSRLDRAVRLFEMVCAVVFVSWWLPGEISFRAPDTRLFAGLSPFLVWGLLKSSELSWPLTLLNVALYGGVGSLFLKGACRGVRRLTAEPTYREAPDASQLWEQYKRLRARSRGGMRQSWPVSETAAGETAAGAGGAPAPSVRAVPGFLGAGRGWWRRLERWRVRPPEWLGSLVSGELKRTSALFILIPPATILPSLVFMGATFVRESTLVDGLVEGLQIGAELFGAAVAVAVGLQALAMLSGEKARRTAATLAITPVGGPGMIGWKGAAILAAQGPAIGACVLWVLIAGLARAAPLAEMFVDALAFLATIALAFALGASFSQVARTPIRAAGLMFASIFVLVPAAMWWLASAGWDVRWITGVVRLRSGGSPSWLAVFFLAATVLLAKNLLPKAAAPAHAAAAALAVVAVTFAFGLDREAQVWGEVQSVRTFIFVLASWRGTAAATLAAAAAKLVLAAVLLAPMPLNFTALLVQEPVTQE